MKKETKEQEIVLDLDKIEGKPIGELTPEEVAQLLEPFQTQIADVLVTSVKAAEYMREPMIQVAKLSEALSPRIVQIVNAQAELTKLFETTNIVTSSIAETFVKAIDTRRLVQGYFETMLPSFEALRNIIIDVNTLNSIGKLNENTFVSLQVESAEVISEKEAKIDSVAVNETSFKSISIVRRAEVSVIVSAVSEKIEEKFEEQRKEISDLKLMVRQILENGTQALPAMVNSFNFDFDSLILVINGKPIEFDRPSKQTQLCELFFGSIEDVKKKLHIEDIIEAFGEEITKDRIKEWNEQFYQAKRHLNDRIAIETGLKDFIKFSNQYYEVNPEYRKLF
jgi:hypothetical protein